jgi:hypothetical protein
VLRSVIVYVGLLVMPYSGPGVQDMCVGKELNIANFKNHVQTQPVRRVFQNLHSVLLLWREGRYQALVGEALKRADVVRIVPGGR